MHESNRKFWKYCREKYEEYFYHPSVLEYGSGYVNGSIREYFTDATEYIGVDWRPGRAVDLVSLAHDVGIDHTFSVVASSSMLEHDKHWEASLNNMVKHMSPDGIMILTWGADGCPTHSNNTAPDGQFHMLPLINIVDNLFDNRLHIHEIRYEERSFGGIMRGCVCLVAFKDIHIAMKYDGVIEKLIPGDFVKKK